MSKKPFLSIFKEISENQSPPEPSATLDEDSFLTDELDHQILMHREAHFGGDFGIMLAYYQEEKVGVQPDFELERIAYLAQVEQELGQNLASLVLTGSEAERVAQARRGYEILKEIYSTKETSPIPRLIADLILADNEEPEMEIEAIVSHGTRIVPELLHLLTSEEAFDPLFPGYGYAPYLAMLCLTKIKDTSAIIPLFETLGTEMVFEEEVILEALRAIGAAAQSFLLGILEGRPLTKDNLNAAFALTAFSDQEEVALSCLKQLEDNEVYNVPLLRTYLLYNCELLKQTSKAERLRKLSEDEDVPAHFRQEISAFL